jgi:hypothetical protein
MNIEARATPTHKTYQDAPTATFFAGANRSIVGKTDPQKLSYSGAFEITEFTMRSLAEHISAGYPWMPAVLDDGAKRWQQRANFAAVLAADIDQGMTIEQAQANPFISAHCGLGIPSASSTPELNKFRLVFRLPEPLTGWETIRACNEYLIHTLKAADRACKDASRFFFGAVGREPFILNEQATLPADFEQQAIAWHEAIEAQKEKDRIAAQQKHEAWRAANPDIDQDLDSLIQKALGLIPKRESGTGTYEMYRDILWALKSHYGEAQAVSMMEAHSPDGWDVAQVGRSGGDSYKIGTLFHYAKQFGFKFPEKAKKKQSGRKYVDTNTHPEADEQDSDLQLENEWKCLEVHNHELGEWKEVGEVASTTLEGIPEKYSSSPNCRIFAAKLQQPISEEEREAGDTRSHRFVDGFKVERFKPLADFNFHVERVLQSEDGGGLVLRVERVSAGRLSTSRVIVSSLATAKVADFVAELKKGLGINVCCNVSAPQLQDLLCVRTKEYRDRGGEIFKLADRIGQQEDGTWVFPHIQFTREGKPTTEEESRWVFNPRIGTDEHIPCPEVKEESLDAVIKLVDAARNFFHPEQFPAVLLCMGWVAMAVHHQRIMEEEGAIPILNCFGDKGSGKTVAMETALGLVGWTPEGKTSGLLSHSTESATYERTKLLGGVPFCWDDPAKKLNNDKPVAELLKALYNGAPRVVRGNHQQPHTQLAVTSNHAIGDDQPATRSRLLQLHFPKLDGKKEAFSALRNAIKDGGGALPLLIKLGYPKVEIDALEEEFSRHLPFAHVRIGKSIAMVTAYAIKVCQMAGATEDIKSWVIQNILPRENDENTNQSSLQDFLEKLVALERSSVIGEWNYRKIETKKGVYMALNLSSVWSAFERQFNPIYSQSGLREEITREGGWKSDQRFPDKDGWQTYQRAIVSNNENSDPQKPEFHVAKCILIPIHLCSHPDSDDEDETPQTKVNIFRVGDIVQEIGGVGRFGAVRSVEGQQIEMQIGESSNTVWKSHTEFQYYQR